MLWAKWALSIRTLFLQIFLISLFYQICEIITVSALLRTLGPLHEPPKPIEKQALTQLHSESEDSTWSSSRERPKKVKKYHKNNSQSLDRKKKQPKLTSSPNKNVNGNPNGSVTNGVYVNNAFRHEAEEQATPLWCNNDLHVNTSTEQN